MASRRNRPHILVPGEPTSRDYAPHPRNFDPKPDPAPPNRPLHGAALNQALLGAQADAEARREEAERAGIRVHGAKPGLYVDFESRPGQRLNLSSLESGSGVELVALKEWLTPAPNSERVERATVFVPVGKVRTFISRLEKYANPSPKQKRELRHEKLFDPIAWVRLATLRSLWTGSPEHYPEEDQVVWWEVWLRRHDGNELARLMEFCQLLGLSLGERRLEFDERIVTLVQASPRQLIRSLDVMNDLAELQAAKVTAATFAQMGPYEQAEWALELAQRVNPPHATAPAVCLLDTGMNSAHPLLAPAVSLADCTAVESEWGGHDDGGGPQVAGHGTEMAGLALYGDLAPVLAASNPVQLRHRLESIKILPPRGQNEPEIYGRIIAEATDRAERTQTARLRCFSLAITALGDRDRGQPTSWSAAVDALACGRSFDSSRQGLFFLDDGQVSQESPRARLFVVSAGNEDPERVRQYGTQAPELSVVHDPGQAWNALTVGAFTDRQVISEPEWAGWEPLAQAGDLSPWSSTSVAFAKDWPLKPDIVLEGGNVARNQAGEIDFPVPELCLLSTFAKPGQKVFSLSYATSAATAQAARLAAMVQAEYPNTWPETVRALLVHSARWTPRMMAGFRGASGKRERAQLVRKFGFGVPSVERALRSGADSLTLIAQASATPFRPSPAEPNRRNLGKVQFYELPWPEQVLTSLGEQPVRLRITLSYFIEPNPGRRGWRQRHVYASHGLRFALKAATETADDFEKRLNNLALDDGETKPKVDGDDWFLGPEARDHGSVHSDELELSAVDLASRGMIGVYPVTGWWKHQPKRDRSAKGARYALVVSIETDSQAVDLWTEVAARVGVSTETKLAILSA